MSETTEQPKPAVPPPAENYNPLNERVNEKSYANNNASAFSAADMTSDLREPTFPPPPPELESIPGREEKKEKKPPKEEPKMFNPGLEELPENEKTDRARQMASGLIDVYEKINNLANDWIKISEKKVQKLQMDGAIDINMQIPYDIDSSISLGGFIKEYNQQCNDVCTVDEKFRKDLLPPLTRVLAKHGHGLSDEQQIVFIVGKHAATNGFKAFSMMQTSNGILNFAKEHKASQSIRPTTPMRPVPQEPVYTPEPQYQEPAPVVQMGTTLQEKVMAQHQQNIYGDQGPAAPASTLPAFGDEKKIEGINKIQAKDLREQEARKRNAGRIQRSKKEVLQASAPKPQKKRGPKIGSKRMPKAK